MHLNGSNNKNGTGESIRDELGKLSEDELRIKLEELRAKALETDEELEELSEAIKALEERSRRVKRQLEVLSTH